MGTSDLRPDARVGGRAGSWMRVVVVTVIIGWELWTLFVDDPRYPTLSVVIHHLWHSRAVLVASYVLWVWLGWWIVRPPSAPRMRWARLAALAPLAAFAWWATSLPHDVWRWPSLGIPGAALLTASLALRRLGPRTRSVGGEDRAGVPDAALPAAAFWRRAWAARNASGSASGPGGREAAAAPYRAAPRPTPPPE